MKTSAAILVIVTALFSGCFISAEDDDGADVRASCRIDCDDEVTTCRKGCSGDACFVSCDTDHESCVADCD